MTSTNLEKLYAGLLLDPQFIQLELLHRKPNIFSALKISHYENRHSNFLGWLLDPGQTHGLGNRFLKLVLSDIIHDERVTEISVADVESLLSSEAVVLREWKRIDLMIRIGEVIVVFENKVWSKEHSDQLNRYKAMIEKDFPRSRKVFVFLSPDGSESSSNHTYVNYSYGRIVYILETLLTAYKNGISNSVIVYIEDYIETIRTHFMSNSTANALARKIYANHQELFNFIFNNTPNPLKELNNYFVKKVTEKGWVKKTCNKTFVRFLTPRLENILPTGGTAKGWNGEVFLFEFYIEEKIVNFYYSIAPGNETVRDILKEAVGHLNPENNREFGEHLCFSYRPFEISGSMDLTDINLLDDYFKASWKYVQTVVDQVEESILRQEQKFKTV